MGRYRAPTPPSSPYITEPGYRALQAELKALWKRRAGVTRALTAAAAEGDRSENAEYIYRKKELREIDRRVRYLQKRLPELTVVSTTPTDPTRVFFGAQVRLQDDDGREFTYRIVGPDEISPDKGWISMDAPLARALMKKSQGDEVHAETPAGVVDYTVIAIDYPF